MSDPFDAGPWAGHRPMDPAPQDSNPHTSGDDAFARPQDSAPTQPFPAPGYSPHTGYAAQGQGPYPYQAGPGGPAGPPWPGTMGPVIVNNQNVIAAPNVVVASPPKSVGLAIVLAFFFGPLGMLYSTITGALVMFLANLVSIPLTVGFSMLLTWPIGIVWAAVAAGNSRAVQVYTTR